jgi:hypothetical protein
LREALQAGQVLVDDPAWTEGSALAEAVLPVHPAAEVDFECSGVILTLFVAVWKCDGGFGIQLAVVGDPRSIASL